MDCGGGHADKPFERAAVFQALGYRTSIVRDDDRKPTEAVETAFTDGDGKVIAWRDGRALEDEIFLSLTEDGVGKLLDRAIELHGENLIDEHIKSASQGAKDLEAVRSEALKIGYSPETRAVLGKAARTRKAGWFKSVTWMEDVARDIVGPDLGNADAGFRSLVDDIFVWANNALG